MRRVAPDRQDVAPFVKDTDAMAVWSRESFHEVGSRILLIDADRNRGE